MAKRHWYNGLGGACKVPRSLLGWWYEIKPRDFIDRHTTEPDRYCSDCAKAARLALAAESAPKPSDVVWPKPRPIEEYTGNDPFLGLCKHHGWLTVRPERSKSGNCILGWLTCCPSAAYVIPTHFLPLPPEVR